MLRIRKDLMEDQRLLASVALFRKLYDNQKDSYDVLAEFIRACININSLWRFTVEDCSIALQNSFGFKIPTAVLRTCLKKRLKKEISLTHGLYTITDEFLRSETLEPEIHLAQHEQKQIISDLIEFVTESNGKPLSEANKEKLVDEFGQFFLGGITPGQNHLSIGKFILSKSKDKAYRERLNRLEEGQILYQGIKYSPDIGTINSWRSNYTIYLDTEILFWANGYDGILFKSLFDEFFDLVKEINLKATNESKIKIKYFPETKQEVDAIFNAAEHIFKERRFADPSRTAMHYLLTGCRSRSDIVAKKGTFYSSLSRYNITQEIELNYYEHPQYNCESHETLKLLSNEFQDVPDDKIANVLKFFTKINYLRGGVSNKGLEQSKAILVSGKNLSRSLAWHGAIMGGDGLIPFSTDLDYLTERLWWKLGKGFGSNIKSLVAFDVVARAQIILSSQIASKVSSEFKDLNRRIESGSMHINDANYIIADLKTKNVKPEELSADNLESLSEFLDIESIEAGIRTRRILEEQAAQIPVHITNLETKDQEIIALKRDVYERDLREWKAGIIPLRSQARLRSMFLFTIVFITPLILTLLICEALGETDSLLSKLSFMMSVVPLIWTYLAIKISHNFIKPAVQKNFRKKLTSYTKRPRYHTS